MSNHYGVMILGSIPVKDEKHYYNRLFVVNNGEVDFMISGTCSQWQMKTKLISR